MKILVSGATGFIGRNFIMNYHCQYEIYALLRNDSNESVISGLCKVVRFNDINELYQIARDIEADVLIHFAGVFIANHSENNILDLIDTNIRFSTVLFDAVVNSGCKKIINIGSYWQNYDGEKYNPVNLYAATKQCAEDVLKYYCEARQCKVITLTIFDSYGNQDERRKVINLINNMKDGESLEMSGGEQRLYMVHVDDICKAINKTIDLLDDLQVCDCIKYAVRGDETYSLREVADIYIKVSGKNIELIWGRLDYRPREIMNPKDYGVMVPGWKPMISLEDGLKKMVESN